MEKLESDKKKGGILIAAVKSGSGKTTVTCALLELLKARGLNPCAFKCGPDYIDPLFHKKVLGVPSYNLDSFFSEKKQLRELFSENMADRDIAVVEGVMGLFDGIGGIRKEGSAYQLASILDLPILLVTDVHGMGRSILPLLSGFLAYDNEKRIAGILLNRISGSFYHSIAPVIEQELGVPVLGFLPNQPEMMLESRHLGLKLPEEIDGLREQLHEMAAVFSKSVDLSGVINIALQKTPAFETAFSKEEFAAKSVRIGIAKDEAFCFYYEENMRLLERCGAELVFFSPLHDKKLPKDLDALILGGGYPELYADLLEKNVSMRQDIKRAAESEMPSLAECGGFMYLHEQIEDDKGNACQMCGVLPGKCFDTGRLVRFGYIELREKQSHFMKRGGFVKGHEFHYYDSTNNGAGCIAAKPVSEKSWECVHDGEHHFWGFPHLYYPSNPDFVIQFIEKAKAFHKIRKTAE